MQDLLSYLKQHEVWIYSLLLLLGLWAGRKFALGWDEMRRAAFGIERDLARSKLNQATVWLLLALTAAITLFSLTSIWVPSQPSQLPLATSTIDLLVTPLATLPPGSEGALVTPAPGETLTPGGAAVTGCVPGQVEISFPANGDSLTGVIMLLGSANIPNFGFYKYEIARPGETLWFSLNAAQSPVEDGELGEWVTTVLPPGEYRLRLVVGDNQGNMLPPCEVVVTVVGPPPAP
jgi:hypothetical protein